MSDVQTGFARSASLAALGAGSGGFARDRRFTLAVDNAAADALPDPVGDAYARGYDAGAEAAAAAAEARIAATETARQRIETALAQMDAAQATVFADRLRDTVLALCRTVLAEAAITPDSLSQRVTAAAAMFARASDERVIRLHPEDLALVHGRLPETWHCEPDPALDRGTVRVETSGGGVETGPAQWQDALQTVLRGC